MINNRIENAIIALCSSLLTALIVSGVIYFFSTKPMTKRMDNQTTAIVELAKIAKYSYEINNEFDKVKGKDSDIIINLDNTIDALAVDNIVLDSSKIVQDSVEIKKTFWNKLKFWK